MKKIFWTSVFWLVVFFGFTFYMKFFDANMAADVTTWLGATTITTSGEVIPTTGAQVDIMSGINTIQTTLSDMQAKLDVLVGTTTVPTVTPTPIPTVTPTVGDQATIQSMTK